MNPSCSSSPRRLSGRPRRQRGFTLLELLMALGIFAVLSVMAYGGLRSVMNTHEHAERQASRLGDLQTAFTVIGRDIEQMVDRDIRDEFGDRQPALIAENFGDLIEFTRTGLSNPVPARRRSHLQRVAYRVEENQLKRLTWPVLDRAQDSTPAEYLLLDDVTAIEIRFLDEANEWRDRWPPEALSSVTPAPVPMPKAVEITVEAPGWGRVPRLFRVPPGAAVMPPPLPSPAT